MWQLLTDTVAKVVPFVGNKSHTEELQLIEELQKDAQLLADSIVAFDKSRAEDLGGGHEDAAPVISDDQCFHGKGMITKLDDNYGFVNDTLYFDPHNISASVSANELRVGTVVCYLAHRLSDDIPVRIVRIVSVVASDWDEPTAERTGQLLEELRHERPQAFSTCRRSMLGEVIGRRKQYVQVQLDNGETENLDLDAVRVDFVPMCGDLVVLDCKVQEDLSFGDMAGQVVDVMSINASRSKCEEGVITSIDAAADFGVVSRMYGFHMAALDREYVQPQKGDKVMVDAIECSNRSQYAWRCVKVVLMSAKTMVRSAATGVVSSSAGPEFEQKQNKEGLVVSDDLIFKFTALGERAQLSINIHNGADEPHTLVRTRFTSTPGQSQLRLVRPNVNHKFTIQPGQNVEYVFEATAKLYGHCTENIVFQFGPQLSIMRHIHLSLDDQTGATRSIGTGSNVYRNKTYTHSVWTRQTRDVIPGVRLNERANFVAVKLGSWDVPRKLSDAVLANFSRTEIDEQLGQLLPCFGQTLAFGTYEKCMHNLLHLEEIQLFHNIRRYDRERAHFRREHEFLSLAVPNMAETRPSLVLGDYVIATNPWANDAAGSGGAKTEDYRGDIHRVLGDRVLLKFNENFHSSYNGEDWKLTFHFSRMSLRKCHYAVQRTVEKMGETFLFPHKLSKNASVQLDVELDADGRLVHGGGGDCDQAARPPLPWFNANLNAVQKEAVKNVLRGEARPMPYVIFGPPGTGKTSTLIETILQLFAHVPDSRLLVATPSNSAANLITQRLIDSGRLRAGDFVRVAGFNAIEAGRIPDELLPYTATCSVAAEGTVKEEVRVLDSGVKLRLNASSLGRHRVTIGTCNSLGTLMQMEFARNHFTHALMDEAGQCLEPEALIPITFVSREAGQVVLAGDPMQLGPVVLSRYAIERGLAVSLLVRILESFPYQIDRERFQQSYDPRLVTKLLYCYRSLPSIMSLFSVMFYHNELRATISAETSAESQLLTKLDEILPGRGQRTEAHGVFFIGVRGQNAQDDESPSWYNPAEAKSILMFLLKLYKCGVSPDDIGIITPYTKQVKVIRNLIAEQDIKVPKIGTVEEFQGQERMIVLLSTVRSAGDQLRHDRTHQLGFVSHPKRLNVAISRPRAMLMVFGNPHLLSKDAKWRVLIKNCVQHKTYEGCDFPAELLERRDPAKRQRPGGDDAAAAAAAEVLSKQ